MSVCTYIPANTLATVSPMAEGVGQMVMPNSPGRGTFALLLSSMLISRMSLYCAMPSGAIARCRRCIRCSGLRRILCWCKRRVRVSTCVMKCFHTFPWSNNSKGIAMKLRYPCFRLDMKLLNFFTRIRPAIPL